MFRQVKRCVLLIAASVFAFSIFPLHSMCISTSATAAVLMDVDSGRVLYEQNAHAKMLIASTTKIMTALVALEEGDLSQVVTVQRSETLVEGSSMYLREGEKLTLETLLYGLLLCSGNDAALAVADAVGGSQVQFVAMMNEKAKALGMMDTSFANPNGLDDAQHYSTAMDMAKLACAAVENEHFVRIASTKSITLGGRTMKNHNKLLSYMDHCIGLKTGYTRAAGRTLVSCAVKNGQRLVAVTLQDGNDWVDHQLLYEYGFSTFPAKRVVQAGETVGTVPVSNAAPQTAPLVAGSSFSWPCAEGEEVRTVLNVPETLKAPLSTGAQVGEMTVTCNGKEIGRIQLLCGSAVLPELTLPMTRFHQLEQMLYQ